MNAVNAGSAKSIVVIAPSWVGDLVMATPCLRALRCARPDSTMHLLVRPGLDGLIDPCPFVDHIHVCNSRGIGGPLRMARAIRACAADAVVLLPNSFRTGLGAFLSRSPVRIGMARDGRGWMLTRRIDPGDTKTPTPMVDTYLRLATAAIGETISDRRMELSVDSDQAREVDQLLDGVGQRYIVLIPGANRSDKRWPAERFAAVARHVHATRKLLSVVAGSPSETDIARSICADAPHASIDLIERGLSLASLKSIIAGASLVITNDTGPRHIAVALGVPVVALYGPTDHRWTTLDAPDDHPVLAEPFLPDNFVADQHPKACDIKRITVGDVLAIAEHVLDKAVYTGESEPVQRPELAR